LFVFSPESELIVDLSNKQLAAFHDLSDDVAVTSELALLNALGDPNIVFVERLGGLSLTVADVRGDVLFNAVEHLLNFFIRF